MLTCPPQLQLHLHADSKLAAAVQLQLRRHGLLVGRFVLHIDIPSKVMVVGDVTPLGVLTGVSKIRGPSCSSGRGRTSDQNLELVVQPSIGPEPGALQLQLHHAGLVDRHVMIRRGLGRRRHVGRRAAGAASTAAVAACRAAVGVGHPEPDHLGLRQRELGLQRLHLPLQRRDGADAAVDGVAHARVHLVHQAAHRVAPVLRWNLLQVARTHTSCFVSDGRRRKKSGFLPSNSYCTTHERHDSNKLRKMMLATCLVRPKVSEFSVEVGGMCSGRLKMAAAERERERERERAKPYNNH
ncbi:uncharacterized protein LOC119269120 [Triticum dicoccoides]|uniref:uncharacterized protein LOC119269120 n=1 Tax=Triticum dicoccoides TaxID=85692 RepID=UPI0018905ABA|nr:uncharacterized protein LOC119269120 [Triticum dicoccoides]